MQVGQHSCSSLLSRVAEVGDVQRHAGAVGFGDVLVFGGGLGDQADPVSVRQEHGQGAAAVPADVELEAGVVADDGSLVARLDVARR